jgi:hypothetical protein
MQHFLNNEEHTCAISLSDLSVWCYACESYVVDDCTYDLINQIHIEKFGHGRNETPIPEKSSKKLRKRKRVIEVADEEENGIDFCHGLILPSAEEKITALGTFGGDLPAEYAAHESLFSPIPKPTHQDDWLAQYIEKPQSFDKWFKKRPNVIRLKFSTNLYSFL